MRRSLASTQRVVLAISGGRDSMVLLDAAARVARDRIAAVATFDHRSGAWSRETSERVEQRARALGLAVERAVMPSSALRATEASWREARWRFLRRAATERRAVIATAHTRDDQIETVLLRVLRGAGARGLAGLAAEAPGIVRPLLDISREMVECYAAERALEWTEDPSNLDRTHLRNRVRLDLLPSLRAARPNLEEELLATGSRAAEWRREVERYVANTLDARVENGELAVARASLVDYDAKELGVLWPALAALVGVTLDRRGTSRLAMFTIEGRAGGRIQLSGRNEVVLHAGSLRLRRSSEGRTEEASELADGVVIGSFRFHVGSVDADDDPWLAELPADRRLTARGWHPGDRMQPRGAEGQRRVKRLLREAGIDAAARRGWPVVLADDEIVWIPGVRRARAATVRPGGPIVRVLCERILDR